MKKRNLYNLPHSKCVGKSFSGGKSFPVIASPEEVINSLSEGKTPEEARDAITKYTLSEISRHGLYDHDGKRCQKNPSYLEIAKRFDIPDGYNRILHGVEHLSNEDFVCLRLEDSIGIHLFGSYSAIMNIINREVSNPKFIYPKREEIEEYDNKTNGPEEFIEYIKKIINPEDGSKEELELMYRTIRDGWDLIIPQDIDAMLLFPPYGTTKKAS